MENNRRHQAPRTEDAALEARIQSFELAFRMQREAEDAFDIEREPRHVRELDTAEDLDVSCAGTQRRPPFFLTPAGPDPAPADPAAR